MTPQILVIDDELYVRRLIEMSLTRHDFEVLQASSAAEGLEILGQTQIAAITCDLMMPGMNGLQFLKTIQANPDLEHIPVILITAAGTQEDMERALSLGAAGALIKPFSEHQLLETIRQALSPGEARPTTPFP